MGKITNEIVKKAYDVAKEFYHERISLKQAQDILVNDGMNSNSAMDYIYNYSNLIQGKLFTRTTSAYGTDYYLQQIYDKYLKLLYKKPELTIFPDEVNENVKYAEGKTKTVLVNSYERNQVARQKCIEHYGAFCQVCNFDFGKIYGILGKDFIHVHHVIDIATIGNEYSVDPIRDLIPVCPNCHSMLHKKTPAYLIDEIKEMMK